MIIQRNKNLRPPSKGRKGILASTLISSVFLIALNAVPMFRSLSNDIDPIMNQVILMICGAIMLLAAVFPARKAESGDDQAAQRVQTSAIIRCVVIVLAGVSGVLMLGYRGETLTVAMITGCGALLILAVVLPQALLRLK